MPTGGNDFSIIRATLDDLDVLAPLFDAYRVFYNKPFDSATARAFLRERLSNDESVIFVARRNADNQALGFVQLYPCFSSVSARRLWILNDLYVDAGARRLGVARALMEAARQHAVETGAVRLTLSTAIGNTQAQALYESLGYVRGTGMFDYALEL